MPFQPDTEASSPSPTLADQQENTEQEENHSESSTVSTLRRYTTPPVYETNDNTSQADTLINMTSNNPSEPSLSSEFLLPSNINTMLYKVSVCDKLTDNNYVSWALSINRALRSLGLHQYLKDEESMTCKPNFSTFCECITNWMLNSMDAVNSNRMQSKIMIPDNEDLELFYSPQKLWEETRLFHAPPTEAARFRLETELDNFKQGYKIDTLTHLDKFNNLKDRFILSGGKKTSDQLARRLLHSLNPSHKDIVDSIIRNISPLAFDTVESEIKRILSESNTVGSSGGQASHIQDEANQAVNFRRKTKCTPTQCQGPHPAASCFAKPENFAARDKRRDELIAAGKWRGPIPITTAPTSTNVNHAGPSDVAALNLAMQQMSLASQANHTTVLNCQYYCSNTAATAPDLMNDWALNDTGASHHMFRTTVHFIANSIVPNPDPSRRLTLAGGDKTLSVHSVGIVELLDVLTGRIELHHALYVPELNKNLIAGGALVKKGVTSLVHPEDPKIFSMFCNGRRLFDGFFSGNLMFIRLRSIGNNNKNVSTVPPSVSPIDHDTNSNQSLFLLHKRLGHTNHQYLRRMIEKESVDGIKGVDTKPFDCISCTKSKSQSLPFSKTRPRANDFLQNIHVDLSGIVRNESLNHISYFILFTDDFSSMRFVYPLSSKNKETVFPVLESFISYAERQTDKHVKIFTLDCGSEFFNSLFEPFCMEKGITLHATAPYTPEQNGVSERSMKTINSKARAMLL